MGIVIDFPCQAEDEKPDLRLGFKRHSRYWWIGKSEGAAFFARTAIELAGKYVAWLQQQNGIRDCVDAQQYIENIASMMVLISKEAQQR